MSNASFDKLVTEVRACKLCAQDLPVSPNPIFQIDPRARILIAGQAPGRKAHETGIPFSDPSGDRLRAWMGVTKETFYTASKIAILPMGFCYPGTGVNGDLPPWPECAITWRKSLIDRLPNIELILVIGQYSAAWHFKTEPKSTLTNLVKDWRNYWPHALPMPHPSPRNQRWLKKNPWFEDEVLIELKPRIAMLVRS